MRKVTVFASLLLSIGAAQSPSSSMPDLSGEWICEAYCPAGGVGRTARIVQEKTTLHLINEGGMKSEGQLRADFSSIVASDWQNGTARIGDGGRQLIWANGTKWTRAFAKVLNAVGRVDIYGIHFDIDSAVIKPESKAALDEVAQLLTQTPQLKLEVAGHTDNTGTKAHNYDLSQRRATAVVDALVGSYGIGAARLVAKGYGDSAPVAANDSDVNRAKNRRVELKKR
jgi:outer membrane protein OmpA-like peptidoglycan-associated protein